jgi:hypothetical protein
VKPYKQPKMIVNFIVLSLLHFLHVSFFCFNCLVQEARVSGALAQFKKASHGERIYGFGHVCW